MPHMLDVSDEVRSEIGDDEADRLLGGTHAPDTYECTSCRTPGHTLVEPTSTVLFVADETAVLAFAHSRCIPSQVVPVSEEQLRGAVASISQAQGQAQAGPTAPAGTPTQFVPDPRAAVAPQPPAPVADVPAASRPASGHAVLGITCGMVMHGSTGHAALVVEPTGPVGRPGSTSGEDEFLSLLQDAGFQPLTDIDVTPGQLSGWSVLMVMGQLHAILQPAAAGGSTGWWQAHQPLQVTDAWRVAAGKQAEVTMYAVPVGTIGRQPREDMLRLALERAAAQGRLVGASLPLAGT